MDCNGGGCLTSCGGSLIHEDIVLTAGHCDDITSNQVIVGAYQNLVYGLGAELKTITQRRRHPNFFLMDQVVPEYDYLVLKLSSPVRRIDFFFFGFIQRETKTLVLFLHHTLTIRLDLYIPSSLVLQSSLTPIRLNSNPNIPVNNELLTVIGFGVTTENGTEPNYLRQVNVNAVSQQTCNADYGGGGGIVQNIMLCAGKVVGQIPVYRRQCLTQVVRHSHWPFLFSSLDFAHPLPYKKTHHHTKE